MRSSRATCDWLDALSRSLARRIRRTQRWTVRRDGGDFDAFTGATITPRAIVKAVRNALEFYQRNSQRIFDQPAADERRAAHSFSAARRNSSPSARCSP